MTLTSWQSKGVGRRPRSESSPSTSNRSRSDRGWRRLSPTVALSTVLAVVASLPAPALLAANQPPRPAKRRFAIVVGSNSGEPRLKYAGDDARLNAEVLRLAGYTTELLVTEKRKNEHDKDEDHDPTRDEVVSKIKEVVSRVPAPTEALFWYSGHGDNRSLHLGNNSTLNNDDLKAALLEPLAGKATVHIIIDACGALAYTNGSGKVVHVRGAKASEPISAAQKAVGLEPERFPDVGIIVATTLKLESIEYPALGAGLFSYQMRMALLNGADASKRTVAPDGTSSWAPGRDRKITYREAEAFVWAANATVDDKDVRMYVWARGRNDPHQVLLDWDEPGDPKTGERPIEITMSGDDKEHFWVQEATGKGQHLFRINKGKEQTGGVGARYFVPRRRKLKIGTPGGTTWEIATPPSGRMTWADIKNTEPLATARMSEAERNALALEKGHFAKAYTSEVYADYEHMKATVNPTQSNDVLIKGAGSREPVADIAPPVPRAARRPHSGRATWSATGRRWHDWIRSRLAPGGRGRVGAGGAVRLARIGPRVRQVE